MNQEKLNDTLRQIAEHYRQSIEPLLDRDVRYDGIATRAMQRHRRTLNKLFEFLPVGYLDELMRLRKQAKAELAGIQVWLKRRLGPEETSIRIFVAKQISNQLEGIENGQETTTA